MQRASVAKRGNRAEKHSSKRLGTVRGVKDRRGLFLSENEREKSCFSCEDFNFSDSVMVFWKVTNVLH